MLSESDTTITGFQVWATVTDWSKPEDQWDSDATSGMGLPYR